MLSAKPVVGLKRYAAVADEEGLRITSQEATLAGVSSVVLSWNFEVMQLPRSMLTIFVWSAIIVTGWLTAKTLSNFEVVIVACAVEAIVAATSLASFVLCITTTNSSRQGGANRIWGRKNLHQRRHSS